MRWLVLIILFLALRLFGVDATWAGAIAYIVFLGMGQSRRSMLIKPPSNESVPPTPVVGDVPPIDLKQLTEDIDQILIILRRALRTPPGRSALEPDKATEDRVHVETLLDFALSSVWPRIKEENAWVRYGNPKDSELVREFDRL